jgi:hypothetical protein
MRQLQAMARRNELIDCIGRFCTVEISGNVLIQVRKIYEICHYQHSNIYAYFNYVSS